MEKYVRRAREEGRVRIRDDLTMVVEGAATVAPKVN